MEIFKLYSISDEYIEWLRKDLPNVYSNKMNARTHTRKYLGVVMQIGKYNYYIPMSSPKTSDRYKDLVQNEMIFIRKNREKIASNAKLLYKQKVTNDFTAGYVKSALDYQGLEILCDSFEEYKNSNSDGK